MPAVPATTTRLGLPRYDNDTDPADFATQVNAISDLIDTLVARRDESLPIGGQAPYGGTGDPAGAHWLLCDGRQLDVAAYPELQAVIGFRYSPGGNDPGGGHFHLPDKRGRGSMGPDTMGTAQGAAGRLTTAKGHPNIVGQNGGVERHQLSGDESGMPLHSHTASQGSHSHTASGSTTKTLPTDQQGYNAPIGGNADYGATSWPVSVTVDAASAGAITVANAAKVGAAQEHNNVQPYEVDNWIIRAR